MKRFFLILTLFIFINASTLPQDENGQSTTSYSVKSFQVHFFSLKKKHHIASSYFHFEEKQQFAIKIPGEEFLKGKGSYTRHTLQLKANFEGTIIKQKKHYHYLFDITGISLFDTYIAGLVVLNESIKETHQDQKVTFLFIGKPEESNQSDERSLFPF